MQHELSSDDIDELSPEKERHKLHKHRRYITNLEESEHEDGENRAEALPRSRSQRFRHGMVLSDDDDEDMQDLQQGKSGVIQHPDIKISASCGTFKWVTGTIANCY